MAWLIGWQYRRKITIDGSKIEGNLTNFPIAVILNSTRFSFSKARSDGYDIRFADEAGNLLKYERERHDATNQVAEYHVKIPSLTAGQNYEFYIYYGNPDASDGADPTNVWDSNFRAVWHLKDYTSNSVKDSTSNGLIGNKVNNNEPLEVDGKIGKAQSFDGTNDYIEVARSSVTEPTTAITVEAWVFNPTNQKRSVVHHWYGYTLEFFHLGGSSLHEAGFVIYTTSGSKHLNSTVEPQFNQWLYLVGTYDSSTGQMRLYENATLTAQYTHSGTLVYSNRPLRFGCRSDSFEYFYGKIDEIRISDVARSAAWIKASYHSGNDTLLSFGPEETFTPLSSRRLLLANW